MDLIMMYVKHVTSTSIQTSTKAAATLKTLKMAAEQKHQICVEKWGK